MSLHRALVKKRSIVSQLADVQLECEELEHDMADGLGEDAAKKTVTKIYDLGNAAQSAKGRLMLSISNITYKSVEVLGS